VITADLSSVKIEGPHEVALIKQKWLCPDSAHGETHQEMILIFLHKNEAVRNYDFSFLKDFLGSEDGWVKALVVNKTQDEVVADFLEIAKQSGFDTNEEVALFGSFEQYAADRVRCGKDGCDCSPTFPGRDELLAQAKTESE
jgi:hypothetical protein